MPQQRTNAIPLNDYVAGVYTPAAITVPAWANWVKLEIRRQTAADMTIWPSASILVKVALKMEFAAQETDNGSIGFGSGGIRLDESGQEMPYEYILASIPPGSGRKIRVVIEITGGTCRTEGTYELSS